MTTPLKILLARRLREERIARGYSQDEIAEILGRDRTAYTYYENGRTQPSLEALIKLSKLYGLTLDELVYGCHTPWPPLGS